MAKQNDKQAIKPALTYKLKHPVTWGKETIMELNFRRLKGKDLRKLPAEPTTGDLIDLAEACLIEDFTTAFFDELDGLDTVNICEEIGNFLEASRRTGKKR